MAAHPTDVALDPAAAGLAFPPIHEGRYEVDPWSTGLRVPVPPGVRAAVSAAGVRLLRVGMGCWLPGQDPDPSTYPDREWFHGTTLEDTEDDSLYHWTHLDRNLEICRDLDVELLLCFDYMPKSLARPGGKKKVPLLLRPFAPSDYQFANGVREAPPLHPEVFAAACVKALEHVKQSGVRVRYVELWNEPDLPFFYAGTYAEYFSMYAAFAPAVSAAGYRVGGPSWAAMDEKEWLTAFLRDCKAQGVPLDFYSFHRYQDSVSKVLERCHEVRRALDDAGLAGTEAVLDEWGYDLRDPLYMGTVGGAAFIASCLMQLPAAGIAAQTHVLLVDPLDASVGRMHGLTTKDGDANPISFCMEAFEQFQSTPHRIATGCDDVVLAGVDASGATMTVLLTNPDKKKSRSFQVRLAGTQGVGKVRHLTQSSFDEVRGWTTGAQVELGEHALEIELAPESLAVVTAQLSSP